MNTLSVFIRWPTSLPDVAMLRTDDTLATLRRTVVERRLRNVGTIGLTALREALGVCPGRASPRGPPLGRGPPLARRAMGAYNDREDDLKREVDTAELMVELIVDGIMLNGSDGTTLAACGVGDGTTVTVAMRAISKADLSPVARLLLRCDEDSNARTVLGGGASSTSERTRQAHEEEASPMASEAKSDADAVGRSLSDRRGYSGHTRQLVDVDGEFVRWSCCGSNDPSPASPCLRSTASDHEQDGHQRDIANTTASGQKRGQELEQGQGRGQGQGHGHAASALSAGHITHSNADMLVSTPHFVSDSTHDTGRTGAICDRGEEKRSMQSVQPMLSPRSLPPLSNASPSLLSSPSSPSHPFDSPASRRRSRGRAADTTRTSRQVVDMADVSVEGPALLQESVVASMRCLGTTVALLLQLEAIVAEQTDVGLSGKLPGKLSGGGITEAHLRERYGNACMNEVLDLSPHRSKLVTFEGTFTEWTCCHSSNSNPMSSCKGGRRGDGHTAGCGVLSASLLEHATNLMGKAHALRYHYAGRGEG